MEHMFIRVHGKLVPLTAVTLVQLNPNKPTEVSQELPLSLPIERLMAFNEEYIKREVE